MLRGKGRTLVDKVDQNDPSVEVPEGRNQDKALRHDVNMPLEDTSLSTVVYVIGGGVLLYLIYVFAF